MKPEGVEHPARGGRGATAGGVIVPMKPEGVEHMVRRRFARAEKGIVPMKPEGVEHCYRPCSIALGGRVIVPMKPEGVEHLSRPAGETGRPGSDRSYEAGRR